MSYSVIGYTMGGGGSLPTVGLGQATLGANYLDRTTNLPTFDSCTLCGYYYYPGQSGDWQSIASLLNSSTYNYLGINIGSDVPFVYSSLSGVLNGTALIVGTWYFWAMITDSATVTTYMKPAGTALTTPDFPIANMTTGNGSVHMYINAYFGGSYAIGYAARARAWNGVLTVAELNAERISATAVKAGSLWDAPFTSLSDLGGFSISGTVTTGP